MKRSFEELVALARDRDNPVPPGSVLLTGTGLVPPDDFTLLPGHFVEIHVPEIGTLVNPVVRASELMRRSPSDDRDPDRRAGAQLRRRRVAARAHPARRTRSGTRGGPSVVTGTFPASAAEDARAAVAAAQGGVPRLVGASRGAACGVLHEGGRRDRGARRAGRAGHDRRDGQAAARGADGDAARGADPPLRGGRGVAPDRRAVRAVGRRISGCTRCDVRSASSG